MCEYCEGRKKFEAVYKGEGIMTMRNAVGALIGSWGKGDFDVARIEHGMMLVDNSSGEYAELGFKINYCPNCGARVKGEDNATD